MDQAGNPANGTARIVGEQVQLQARSIPPGLPLANIQWNIPGQLVRNYVQAPAAGVVTPVAPADLTRRAVTFYWIAGGAQAVQVSANVGGAAGPRLTARANIAVAAPAAVGFVSTTSVVQVGPTAWRPMELSLGTGAPLPGISWRTAGAPTSARAPAPVPHPGLPPGIAPYGSGQLAMTQLVRTVRTRRTNAPGNVLQEWTSLGAFVLDDPVPYSGVIAPIARGAVGVWNSNDTPGSPLNAGLARASASDDFQAYFMYRPNLPNAIWVTLSVMAWSWRGGTNRLGPGNVWAPPAPANNTVNPVGAASTQLPTWSAFFTGLGWRVP